MDIVNQIIKQFIPQMSNVEREELLTCLVATIDRELADSLSKDGDNPIAREVKIEDLRHNINISRIPSPQEEDYARVLCYCAQLNAPQN